MVGRLLAVALALGCAAPEPPAPLTPLGIPSPTGALARSAALWTVDGEPRSLDALLGPVGTIVVVTAGWCRTCEAPLGVLAGLAPSYAARGVRVVVINVDADLGDGRHFVRTRQSADVAHVLAGSEARAALRSDTLVPTTLLLDGDGSTLRRYDGEIAVAELTRDVPRIARRPPAPSRLASR